jgi:hypothetical protein
VDNQEQNGQTDKGNIYLKKNNNINIGYKNPPSDLSLAVPPSDYQKAYGFFKGHTLTNTTENNQNAILFDGSQEMVDRLSKLPASRKKPGLFISRQECKIPRWTEESVSTIRNITIEHDGFPYEQQLKVIEKSGIPHSCAVYSGNKSIHFSIFLTDPISKEQLEHWVHILTLIFPKADKTVLKTLNKLVRFPVVNNHYHQPLLYFHGPVENKGFQDWIEAKKKELELESEEAFKSSTPIEGTQIKLRQYWESNGKRPRNPCPLCIRNGQDPNSRNLVITEFPNEKLKFWCHCCEYSGRKTEITHHFIEQDPDKNPNAQLDLIQSEIQGVLFYEKATKTWYEAREYPNVLKVIPNDQLNHCLYPIYEQVSRKLGLKLTKGNFESIIALLGLKNGFTSWQSTGNEIALKDGSLIEVSANGITAKGLVPEKTTFYLNISPSELFQNTSTPCFDKFLSDHATAEDGLLLLRALGYMLSGSPVYSQQWMLVIYGPPDTGKSQLIKLLELLFGDHFARISINDALTKPILAAGLIGKRVSAASEATVHAKNAENFRQLVSGEALSVKLLFRGEDNVPHNVIFVSATNNIAWIENSPENQKRIRVIKWNNPIPRDQQDTGFQNKLAPEIPGIIYKSLLEYGRVMGRPISINSSSLLFMKLAGENVNPVAAWADDQKISSGTVFNATKHLFKTFVDDTGSKLDQLEFGRKFKVFIGEDYCGKGKISGTECRGYFLNHDFR